MADLTGQAGELCFTVQVTRKETGKVDEYELTGKLTSEQAEKLGLKEKEDGSNTPSSSPASGD